MSEAQLFGAESDLGAIYSCSSPTGTTESAAYALFRVPARLAVLICPGLASWLKFSAGIKIRIPTPHTAESSKAVTRAQDKIS